MRIAFYAPLKSPRHPVPSGDRQMARMLMRALELGGHEVTLASEFRSFRAEPEAGGGFEQLNIAAAAECDALAAAWAAGGAPDLWFSYHSYYKAPDLLGPRLARRFGVPIVTAEASYAGKRDRDPWSRLQAEAMRVVQAAALNLCFTARDREGLAQIVQESRLARLFPFIDTRPFVGMRTGATAGRIVTVAMMRDGDKLASYRMLAAALERIAGRDWRLRIVGDGPRRADVERLFSGIEPGRIEWLGERRGEDVPGLLDGALFAWPGCGEAYGLAYLEAQAAGLPVVAQATAGVPEVVLDGQTGLLSPEGEVGSYADALATLLADATRRQTMAETARRFVLGERSLDAAAARISGFLREVAA